LQTLLERASDGHDFADAFHLRGQRRIGHGELFEGEPRNLHDDVVNRRLEARVSRREPSAFVPLVLHGRRARPAPDLSNLIQWSS
jgi:hypothetical protein